MLAEGRENFDQLLQKFIRLNTLLHIVCLDAPSPPDYGGAIDMFYKIKALAKTGCRIILHYFNYNPGRNAKDLENCCEAVYTYKRKPFLKALPVFRPFIIESRINEDLIKRLNQDNHPVLLEGLHCSGIIPFLKNPQRIVLRMHNNEAAYYHHLAKTEKQFLKRLYFRQESRLLTAHQRSLNKMIKLACLSQSDATVLRDDYNFEKLFFIPCFIPWQQASIKEGRGDYCLYHGNMAISENEEAALWLIRNVFSRVAVPLLIAGKDISKKLQAEASLYSNVSFANNPSISTIDELIRNAQVNVLPSMNNTGVKLKLLNALLNGRHCLTNRAGAKGSGIQDTVTTVESPGEWIESIQCCMQQDFTTEQAASRKAILDLYDNDVNAKRLNALW